MIIPPELKALLASSAERKWERRRLEAYEIKDALRYIGEDSTFPLPTAIDELPDVPRPSPSKMMGGKNLLWLARAGARL